MTETDTGRLARTGLSSLELSDQAAAAVQKTPNRVTLDRILAKITDEEFWHPLVIPHMTVVALKLENGYVVLGKSTPADAANFDAELGRKFAREDATRQIWALEAYLLRQQMTYGSGEAP